MARQASIHSQRQRPRVHQWHAEKLGRAARYSAGDILKAIAHKYDFAYPEEKLIVLAKEAKSVVDDKTRYTDWSKRDDIRAELQVELILLLAKHGYPPVANDEVFKEILEQAENFKKYRQIT